METRIIGELAQAAELTFSAGETCWASNGTILSMDPDLPWSLKVPGGAGGTLSRVMSGEGISLTHIEGQRDGQRALLSSNQPGKLMEWDLDSDGPVVSTSGSFVCAYGPNINIEVTMARRAGAAFFGGAGLFMQKIRGSGKVMVHGSGDFIDTRLEHGQSILVSTGNLAAFSADLDYTIQGVAGCRRVLFSGEGLFMTKLTGPGRVLLQSLKRVTAGAKGGGG